MGKGTRVKESHNKEATLKRIAAIEGENEVLVAEANTIKERFQIIPGLVRENIGRIKELKSQIKEG